MKKYRNNRIFILSNPTAPRICPELASEIGLNESILLLQYEFWLATVGIEREYGYVWVRKTIREIQEVFEFWSLGTISNIRRSLLSKGYLISASLDHKPGKGADWTRFNFDRLQTLRSIRLDCSRSEQPMFMRDHNLVQGVNNSPFNERSIERALSISNSTKKKIGSEAGCNQYSHNEDFVLTAEMRSWAITRAPGMDIEVETEKFLNWVKPKAFSIRDWDAAWRNWIIRGIEYRERNAPPQQKEHPLKASELDALLEGYE